MGLQLVAAVLDRAGKEHKPGWMRLRAAFFGQSAVSSSSQSVHVQLLSATLPPNSVAKDTAIVSLVKYQRK